MGTKATEATQASSAARASMLRIARAWQSAGHTNQAIGAYSRLRERYPNSVEAREAAGEILAMAQAYERQRRYHLAMDLYQQLEGRS